MFNKSIYTAEQPPRPRKKLKWVAIGVGALVLVAGLVASGLYFNYNSQLQPVDPSSSEPQVVIVNPGDSVRAVSEKLVEQGLIKDAQAMQWYIRFQANDLVLRQGAFEIRKNQSVAEIVETLKTGKILRKTLTILPAATLFDIEDKLIEAEYTPEEAKAALAADYSFHPALGNKPEEASLEGYLLPNTYFAGYRQSPEALIQLALDEMAKVLDDQELQAGFKEQGLTTHQAIILASIVEQEASDDATRLQVAQVFLKRLEVDMPLGADPTFRYASRLLGIPDSVSADSPYNTRRYSGLPPGPIGAVSRSSLQAVAQPAEGDFLYFVSGDDGNTYFSNTLEEHQANTRRYCIELCKL